MYVTTTGFGDLLPGRDRWRASRAARRSGAGVGPDRRSRHHDPARARRPRPRGGPPLRHAVGVAAGRGARRRGWRRPCAGCATRPAAASPPRSTSWRATAASASLWPKTALPVRDGVRGACELLGLDPLHIANEGQFLAVVAPSMADRALAALARRPAAARRRHRRDPRVAGGHGDRRNQLRRQPGRRHARRRRAAADLLRTGHADHHAPCRSPTPSRSASSRATSLSRAFFAREAPRLAAACREMAERFLRGGRLLAFGGARSPPTRSMSRWSSCTR